MIIGFDFDRVFVNYPPFVPDFLIDILYKGGSYFRKINGKNNLSYRFPGKIEQQLRIFSHAPVLRHPIEKNIRALKKINKRDKCKTYLVSSRFGFLRERTENLFAKENLSQYFNGVYFNYNNLQPHKFKEQTIRRLKIDTYIDDDLDLAIYLSKRLPSLRIFWIHGGKKISRDIPHGITPIVDLAEFIDKYI